MDSFDQIRRKLAACTTADPDLKLFGADKHKYRPGPALTGGEVTHIEDE